MLDGTGAVLAGLAALVSALLLGAPSAVKAYIDLVTFHDRRKGPEQPEPQPVADVLPAPGAIAKRHA